MPTANYAFPYPAGTDAPNVPLYVKNLADAVDSSLDGVDDRVDVIEADYSRGHLHSSGNITTNSATFGTTETLLWSVSFTSVSTGRQHAMYLNTGWTMSGGTATFRLRWAVGGTVTTSSTQIWVFRQAPQVTAGFNRLDCGVPLLTGLTAGTVTVGLTALSDGPTDGVLLAAADNLRRWDVVDLGV